MRTSAIQYIESKQLRAEITPFHPGDTVRVHWKVKEGETVPVNRVVATRSSWEYPSTVVTRRRERPAYTPSRSTKQTGCPGRFR